MIKAVVFDVGETLVGKGTKTENTVVKDVMTSRVIWMEQDTPFAAIAAAFADHRVSAFPVLNRAGEVIGVVSEADLLANWRWAAARTICRE